MEASPGVNTARSRMKDLSAFASRKKQGGANHVVMLQKDEEPQNSFRSSVKGGMVFHIELCLWKQMN